jgi:glycerol-3-phosphate acyltransferase PlsY
MAYLIGSIPFGYLIVYWRKGIDIRTVGSGNIGATNVNRVLGRWYFLLVLLLDGLKGYLPAAGFPWLFGRAGVSSVSDLPVLTALAAILGHTFPVYLQFRGGKGIATSLGAVLALDAISSLVAIVVFLGVFGVTHYIALASLVSCLAFAVAHFARVPAPFERAQIAMSLFTIGVIALVYIRHRANIARLRAGTEPRTTFGKGTPTSRQSGHVNLIVLVACAVMAVACLVGFVAYKHAHQVVRASAGPWSLTEADRADTGQQRVDRIAFAAGGTRLAATCPRYDRVMLYNVESPAKLTLSRTIELHGRPESIASMGDRFVVLSSPGGDRKHLEPGWWQIFDKEGQPLGEKSIAGYYVDDIAVSPGCERLFVLTSGRAEGDAKKPLPTLEVIALDDSNGAGHHTVGRLTFGDEDDLERIQVSASGQNVAVYLPRTHEVAAIDVSVPESPRLIGRTKASDDDAPYLSYSRENDWILMPVGGTSDGVALRLPRAASGQAGARPDYIVCTRQKESMLELFQSTPRQSLGQLPLRGPFNLGRTRPTSVAYAPELGLLAVSTRTGTIHLIELESRLDQSPVTRGRPHSAIATRPDSDRPRR